MSPIIAIPHKIRTYRLILDLSFRIKVRNTRMLLVNEISNPATPRESLDYIKAALPYITHTIAIAETNTLCLFTKANIKDSF